MSLVFSIHDGKKIYIGSESKTRIIRADSGIEEVGIKNDKVIKINSMLAISATGAIREARDQLLKNFANSMSNVIDFDTAFNSLLANISRNQFDSEDMIISMYGYTHNNPTIKYFRFAPNILIQPTLVSSNLHFSGHELSIKNIEQLLSNSPSLDTSNNGIENFIKGAIQYCINRYPQELG